MFRNLNIACLGTTGGQSELIELALSYRFRGMDLDILEFAKQVETYGLPHARRLIDSAKIRIGSFRLPFALDDDTEQTTSYEEGLAGLARLAELAAEMGCTRCLAAVEPATDALPYHENFEAYRRRILEVTEILGPLGICLGLEFTAATSRQDAKTFQFIQSFDALIQLVKATATEHVGVVADLWQIQQAGSSFAEIKELPIDRVVAVVLSDVDPGAEPVQRLLPASEGAIDSTAVLVQLAEAGYEGPITPSADRESFNGLNRDATVKLAAERLNEAWKQAGLNAQGRLPAAAP